MPNNRNPDQEATIKEFENEVRTRGGNPLVDWKPSSDSLSKDVLFGDFRGVTLMIYPDGKMNVPAVCSYKISDVVAAATAKELWDKQRARDGRFPEKAQDRTSGGHLGPIVDPDYKCRNTDCPCRDESPEQRQKRARGSWN